MEKEKEYLMILGLKRIVVQKIQIKTALYKRQESTKMQINSIQISPIAENYCKISQKWVKVQSMSKMITKLNQ